MPAPTEDPTPDPLSLALFQLGNLLDDDELLTPTSPHYKANTQPWAAQKDQHPPIVIRPKTASSLGDALAELYPMDMDIAIRGQGFMSTSARDVIISMTAFDEFSFDHEKKLATVGAGQTWSDVYRKMDEAAPEYALVAARTPCVGVGGTVMSGGFSWLSGEYGCISDPHNMVDAEVVLADGTVKWASTEPDLLWALRGGGGGFCAATKFIFRAVPYPRSIWAGPILIPRRALPQVAKGIAGFLASDPHPKVTMFLFVLKKRLLESISAKEDMLVVHAFDAFGEEHGRKAFEWALSIPDAIDQTEIKSLHGVAELQTRVGDPKGTMKQYWTALLLSEMTEEIVIKAVEWFDKIEGMGGTLADSTLLIFELLSSRDPIGPDTDCAWPRPKGGKHILLFGTGCHADADDQEENQGRHLAMNAPREVLGEKYEAGLLPNSAEDFHDRKKIYGENLSRLVELKERYDPERKLKGVIM